MREIILLLGSYLLGAIPIGLILGKTLKGIDIREFGSGNIGATNVMRTLGPCAATCVFIGDALKGLIPVVAASMLFAGAEHKPLVVIAAGLAGIVGHNASVFLKFRGGKGVSTSLGVIIGLSWQIAATVFVLWGLLVLTTRYVSVASLVASCSVCVLMHFPHLYTAHLCLLRIRYSRSLQLC